ncbi:MAG: hypothetical protein IKV03_00510 [Alphaproteobacteria bacterium]|nr:hypothetical protein [Alphaproteobacteria bacterium]
MLRKVISLALLVSAWSLPVAAGFDMLPTKDGQCRFFYPTDKNTQGWTIQVSSQDMCQNGTVNKHGQVTIYNAFGAPVEQIYGFFNGGYWTGDKELSADVIAGYAENSDTYKVSFELSSGTGFDIRYLSQMVSQKQKDTTFASFSFCQPFRVLVQTQDYGLFQDKSLITEIIDEIAQYAKKLCPAEQKIQLFGSSKERPTQDDVFFYADIDLTTAQIDVKRNDANAFSRQENMILISNELDKKVEVQIEQNVVDEENKVPDISEEGIEVNARDINKLDASEEISSLLDKVPHLLTISRLTGKTVHGSVVVKIERVVDKTADVITPLPLQLVGDGLQTGWAIVTGDFSYETGRLGAELKGRANVTSVVPCQQSYCTDIK